MIGANHESVAQTIASFAVTKFSQKRLSSEPSHVCCSEFSYIKHSVRRRFGCVLGGNFCAANAGF